MPEPIGAAQQPVLWAGAVLLWPFLDHFVQRMAAEGEAPALSRARALTALTDGAIDLDTAEVALLRLLFGRQDAGGLAKSSPPSQETVALRDEMLTAVVAQWSVLGTTTPTGLLDTFILRDGMLQHGAEADNLRIAPQPFDILLERLPWSLSILQLPWMPRPLHVTWR
ncbi:MAG: contractile injection system tape measure protein [Paracoccaceae bacterium]|nr:contractile injection system tape measure protein [Paracoccaceae bacterium]